MATEFNYKRAWAELARPAFNSLSSEIRGLLALTTVEAMNLNQTANTLDMPWPEGPAGLREKFDAFDDETLSRAARVVNFYGHWYPGKAESQGALRPGEHWKFSRYCDQILIARCLTAGLPVIKDSSVREKNGFSIAIHEGMARLQRLRQGRMDLKEVCPGTVGNVTSLQMSVDAFRKGSDKGYDMIYGGLLQAVKASLVQPGHWAEPWLAERKFMDHTPGTEYDNEEVIDLLQSHVPAGLEVLAKTSVNHRVEGQSGEVYYRGKTINWNHPFVIGAAHIRGDSTYLDAASAPCDYCGRPVAEHKHDEIIPLRITQDISWRTLVETIYTLSDVITKHNEDHPKDKVNVDGFVPTCQPGTFKIGEPTPEDKVWLAEENARRKVKETAS